MKKEQNQFSSLQNLFESITALGVFIPQTRVISMVIILFEKISPVLADIVRMIANGGGIDSKIFSPSKNQVMAFFEKFENLNNEVDAFSLKTKRKLYKDFLYGVSNDEIKSTYSISQKAIDEVLKWKSDLVDEFISDFFSEANSNPDNMLIGEILQDGLGDLKNSVEAVLNDSVKQLIGKRGQVKLEKIINQIDFQGE